MSTETTPKLSNAISGLSIFALADKLRRAAYIEKAMLSYNAGWFLYIPEWEAKHQIAYHVWNHAEHVNWLVERLTNLRGVSCSPIMIGPMK
ncbi:MAG: hypothetical protein HN368_17970 [Spirochaetales bacterium]|jgi:hypothetical protein|nr:hypothetical protein [Spirochaetales bacterium]